MADEVLKSIKQMSKERGISPDIFYSAIKEALLTVSDKYFDPDTDVQVEINKEKGEIQVYITKLVVKEVTDPVNEISWKDSLKYNSKTSVFPASRKFSSAPAARLTAKKQTAINNLFLNTVAYLGYDLL